MTVHKISVKRYLVQTNSYHVEYFRDMYWMHVVGIEDYLITKKKFVSVQNQMTCEEAYRGLYYECLKWERRNRDLVNKVKNDYNK